MNVPAVIYASDTLMNNIKGDKTIEQIVNVAQLPGIIKNALAMPDAHQGYGFPIGGVAAFRQEDGIISPGGVGFDINCGVRLINTNLTVADMTPKKRELLNTIFTNVPSGVGSKAKIRFDNDETKEVLEKGAKWAIKQGFGWKEDTDRMEENGCMKADPNDVSDRAIARGKPQLGSLGAGNHFLEIQSVDNIFDEKTSDAFGVDKKGQIVIMVHCGSRGLGHQVASEYIRKMEDKYGFAGLPDRELINAPLSSDLGVTYYSAMSGAANYAWSNRQMITHWIRESFEKVFDRSAKDMGMSIIYDVCHNVAKMEKHNVDGEKMNVCVHRKGATRSFGSNRVEIPQIYRSFGQPVIIPGSMGTASYLLCGTKKAEEVSFGSTAHGAGRVMSRFAAVKKFKSETIVGELESKGIMIKSASWKGIVEEAPQVYKDID
ncbi:MAG: RtcB family protein, partial [Candidatus Aenigmarchaeota archaeon]|nr:RtcB family protein [Candidatus Aenigmarchaeota archaeon]